MSSYNPLLPSVARSILSPYRSQALREKSIVPLFLNSRQQVRGAKNKSKGPNKKGPKYFQQKDLKDAQQFALCDAMRYVAIQLVRRYHLTLAIVQVSPRI